MNVGIKFVMGPKWYMVPKGDTFRIFRREGCAALAALLQNPTSNLIGITLRKTTIDDEGIKIISSGLKGNNTITELDIGGNRNITLTGWQAIFDVLTGANCRLEKLDLSENSINDTVAISLINALRNNSTLKTLCLNGIFNISDWRHLLSGLLLSPNGTLALESLHINNCMCNDDVIHSLTTALANKSRLRELNLRCNYTITATGWEAVSTVLHNPNSALETLNLGCNNINDHAIASFTNALAINNRLKELDLSYLRHVTAMGWEAVSTVLRNPNSALEKLDLRRNDINDHAIASLADALAINNRLKELDLSHVPTVGGQALLPVLRSPTSALEKLNLSGNAINDQVLSSFAEALANNNKLKELKVGHYNNDVTSAGYAAFTHILCNTSTILNTFDSNHTLAKLNVNGQNSLPQNQNLICLLKINRENSNSQAAWLKITRTHFGGSDINLQPFTGIDASIHPDAIAWMAKGEYANSDELTLVYQFIRAVPALLER